MLRQTDNCAHSSRWKLKTGPATLFCGGLVVCVFLAPVRASAPLVLGTVVLAALVGARVSARCFLRSLAVPFGFISAGALALALGVEREGGFRIVVSAAGLRTAADTSLRALAASSAMVLYAHTVPIGRLIGLLRRLKVSESLLDLMHLSYRNLFLLEETRESLVRAQDNRLGYSNPARSLRSGGQAGAALFMRAFDRAARLERGLSARAYDGTFQVLERRDETRRADWLLALGVPFLLCLLSLLLGGGVTA